MAGRVDHGTQRTEKNEKAPLGIKIIGVLVILSGALVLIGVLGTYFTTPSVLPFLSLMWGVFFGILSLFLGFGLLSLKSWAWKGYVAVSLINFGVSIIEFTASGFASGIFSLLLALYVYSKREKFS